MGTHNYLVEVFRKDVGETPPTMNSLGFHRYSRTSTGDITDLFYSGMDEPRYMEEYGCRESLLGDSGVFESVFDRPNGQMMLGIRCYGDMYSATSKILRSSKTSKESVIKFIESVFGIKMQIRYGLLEQRLASRVLGNNYISFLKKGERKTKNLNGYVTLYFSSWENAGKSSIDCGISAILALFKEPRVIRGVVQGWINDKKTLCDELIRISVDRLNLEDTSYECFTLAGYSGNTHQEYDKLMERIKEQLYTIHNDDGSDWLSIVLLSVFCFIYSELENEVFSGQAGPVDYVDQYIPSIEFEFFRDFVGEKDSLRYLKKRINKIENGFYDPEDDDDFYDSDGEFSDKVISWANA